MCIRDSAIIKQNTVQLGASTQGSVPRKPGRKSGGKVDVQPPPGLTAQVLNSHYADVSSDSKYTPPPVKQTASPPCSYVTEIEVFRMLDRLKPTATGLDTLPAWFLRLSAPVIAAPQTHTVQLVHQMCSDSTPMEENMHHTHPEGCTPSRGE